MHKSGEFVTFINDYEFQIMKPYFAGNLDDSSAIGPKGEYLNPGVAGKRACPHSHVDRIIS
jgi:hypothetical protein